MKSIDRSEELRFAHHLADLADEISLLHFRRSRARTKADGTLVTEADESVERAIRAEIERVHPDHAVLGEEHGTSDATGPVRWIVDPIDGTNNYASGIPIWATLIALEVEAEVAVGVVSAPALGERYAASRGDGATRNGDPIRVSEVTALSEARLAYPTYAHFEAFGRGEGFERLLRSVSWSRGFGDFWGHMLVAAGSVEVMVEPIVNVWDLAPLIVIVEEAGGRFTDLDGVRRIDGGSALTTNGRLHEEVLEFFDSNSVQEGK